MCKFSAISFFSVDCLGFWLVCDNWGNSPWWPVRDGRGGEWWGVGNKVVHKIATLHCNKFCRVGSWSYQGRWLEIEKATFVLLPCKIKLNGPTYVFTILKNKPKSIPKSSGSKKGTLDGIILQLWEIMTKLITFNYNTATEQHRLHTNKLYKIFLFQTADQYVLKNLFVSALSTIF